LLEGQHGLSGASSELAKVGWAQALREPLILRSLPLKNGLTADGVGTA
jgi:hypothetical protein